MEEKKNVGESNTLISAGASSPKMASRQDDALAAGDVLDPQEQAFLRHYSDSLSRLHAMIAAGYYQNDNTIESKDLMVTQQEVIAQAGAILGRAERLPLPTIASAVGADKVAFLARLWAICCCDKAHEAIKGLQLLGRIHGVWGKDGGSDRRTALVFVSPSPRAHGTVPTDLPFTLSRDAYRMFAEPPEASDEASDSENGRANEPE